MKNFKKIIGAFSILSFIGLNISFASTGIVNTPAARIREKPNTDSEIITKAYEDEEVEILGEDGDWYKVKVNGKTGYVSKSLIKTQSKTTTNKSNTETNSNAESNIINKDTNLKLLPNFASNDLKFLGKNTQVKIEKELNNWVKISLSDNSTGWVLKNNLTTDKVQEKEEKPSESDENTNKASKTNTEENTNTDKTSSKTTSEVKNAKGKVNVETANVREKNSTTSNILGRLDEGDEVTIVGEDGDWYEIISTKVSSGYVSKSLITIITSDVSSRSLNEPREEETKTETSDISNNSINTNNVVEFAKQYLGTSYVSGGKTPESGFDCSGFTYYVFKNFGYTLGTVAANQDSVGKIVERENLMPGDLILFLNEGKTKIGHTGIYIGNNEFIHAANPQRGVVIDNLATNSYYNERFVTARRIIE